MPYDIEVLGIGEDIDPLLERSIAALNGLQDEFRYHLSSPPQRQAAAGFQRSKYTTSEVWNFLRIQRSRFGGNRPFVIAFVTKPLQSANLGNLFGSHEASAGLAVVTTFGAAQYVKEETRYCCYYLVRYCLSFINPDIKAHADPARKNCYFHRKIYKPDIRASMDSGYICDACLEKLDNPSDDRRARRLSDDERDALIRMRQYVSGDLPHAIVMKGGGVKGLAFAGALLELEKYYWFDRHVGTSAGAIAATLLAATYSPAELRDLLLEKDFRDFLDSPIWKVPLNLILRKGCFPGETFRLWIAELLTRRIPRLAEVPMAALNGALIYASRRGMGVLAFDSTAERKDTAAAFAVRCSMSIPFVFFPTHVDGRRVFDGGLRSNFPLRRFLDDHPRSHYIALYLGKPDNSNRRWIGSELLDIIIEGEERQTVDDNIRNIVVIDTSPVGTVDFSLSSEEKDFLLKVGKAAALQFLYDRELDDGPSRGQVDEAIQEAKQGRQWVTASRRRKRARSLILWFAVCLIILSVYFCAGKVDW